MQFLTFILLLFFLHQPSLFAQSPSQEDSDLAEQTAALNLEEDHDHNDDDENDSDAAVENPQAPHQYIFSLPLKTFLWGHLYGPRLLGSLAEAEKLFTSRIKNPQDTTPIMLKSRVSKKSNLISATGNLFAQFHIGTDFKVPVGTPVNSVHRGTVYAMGYMDCPGNTLVIRHETTGAPQPIYTAYKHLLGFAPGLKVGSAVEEGQIVALSGKSGAPLRIVKGKKVGCAGGANLHFEVRLPRSLQELELLNSTAEQTKTVKKKLKSLRIDLIAKNTYVVNPSDYVEPIDQICYARKRVEIQNARLVESLHPGRLAPVSAGLCSENSEKLLQMEFNIMPTIYQRVFQTANLTL